MAKSSYVTGFDIGTRKVVAIIGEITDERKIEIIGIGTADSRGLRKGVVVDLDATTAAIKKAQEEAELMSGVEIGSAFFGISGAHIKSFNSRGVVAASGKNREITREDVKRVIDQSKAVVPGAMVVVTAVETGVAQRIATNADRYYTVVCSQNPVMF